MMSRFLLWAAFLAVLATANAVKSATMTRRNRQQMLQQTIQQTQSYENPPTMKTLAEVDEAASTRRSKEEMITGTLGSNAWAGLKYLFSGRWLKLRRVAQNKAWFTFAAFSNWGSSYIFPYMNFVRGFPKPGLWHSLWRNFDRLIPFWTSKQNDAKFKPPVKGEKMGIVTYNEYALKNFGKKFTHDFFDLYFTGGKVPSNEDNDDHANGMKILDLAMKFSGGDGIETLYRMEPRIAFDQTALIHATWTGFKYLKPHEIKYASNGVHGVKLVDGLMAKHQTKDVLGLLMMDSVFSAHLTFDVAREAFELDLSSMEKYKPLPGYAPLGGKATFKFDPVKARMVTTKLVYKGKTYVPTEDDVKVNSAFKESHLVGWKYAEKAIIASLLSMTNLIMHVKDLHLELAAAFQAVTFDSFSDDPTHPIRRLLDPFIHRSVQATNDNFKLLFVYRAAEFSLAPLHSDEQLKLIDEAIKKRPLNLAAMDMTLYGKVRGMQPKFSQRTDPGAKQPRYFWRWHYRALKVQQLYEDMANCWIDTNFPAKLSDAEVQQDKLLNRWWASLKKHLPAFKRAVDTQDQDLKSWGNGGVLTRQALVNVLRTVMVWVSWIHEDVGHSAAAYVYNPVHTPMCVPEDGYGVPLASHAFNVAAYRGFVFLERAALLEPPPDHWFLPKGGDKKCFETFQKELTKLGATDTAFSECDANGFYSCVNRVETAVSS